MNPFAASTADFAEPRLLHADVQRIREYEALVAAHRVAFHRLALKLTRDADEAEDLLQETLVDAYRAFHRFQPGTHFFGWVGRIMTNNFLDRARRRKHVTVSIDRPDTEAGHEALFEHPALRDDRSNPESLLVNRQMDAPLESALAALQPAHRTTVELCDLEGATYEEAAEATDCPVGTIRSRLHRAHKAIRGFLERIHAEPAPALPIERASSRRAFLRMSTAAAAGAALVPAAARQACASTPVRVRVWFEGGKAHPDLVSLVEGLREAPGVEVTVAGLSDADQGVGRSALRQTDVLIWWARSRHQELSDDALRLVTDRVRTDGMGFIALHGAEASRPFRALTGCPDQPSGEESHDIPGDLRITAPRHPIAQGVDGFTMSPASLTVVSTALPHPEVVILDTAIPGTARREWQGIVWSVDRGRVFAFRPGHPTQSVHQQDEVRQVIRNAVRWAACGGRAF